MDRRVIQRDMMKRLEEREKRVGGDIELVGGS